MFNKIKKNMNMNMKPNRTNKIMILLSLFLILLNKSNNNVYAIDNVKPYDIKVENGQLKITSKGITYEYDGIEETKIRIVNERKFFIYFNEEEKEDEEVNYKSIKLSEEIIKSISGNDETEVTLNYGYFLNGEKVLEINTETVLNEGLLVTGNYNNKYNIISIIKDGKLTVGNDSNNENSLFGIIRVNVVATGNTFLFNNLGETIINTKFR